MQEIDIDYIHFKSSVSIRTGEIDDREVTVSILVDKFIEEIKKHPVNSKGELRLKLKKFFRPAQKGRTHKLVLQKGMFPVIKKAHMTYDER